MEVRQAQGIEIRFNAFQVGWLEMIDVDRDVWPAELHKLTAQRFRRQMTAGFGNVLEIIRKGRFNKCCLQPALLFAEFPDAPGFGSIAAVQECRVLISYEKAHAGD